MLTYNAYDKGILPEVGGLGSQPLRFLPMMALLHSRTNAEQEDERERRDNNGKGGKGKRSLTEDYLEQRADLENASRGADTISPAHSPDGYAAVPGLLKPRVSKSKV